MRDLSTWCCFSCCEETWPSCSTFIDQYVTACGTSVSFERTFSAPQICRHSVTTSSLAWCCWQVCVQAMHRSRAEYDVSWMTTRVSKEVAFIMIQKKWLYLSWCCVDRRSISTTWDIESIALWGRGIPDQRETKAVRNRTMNELKLSARDKRCRY